MYRTFTESLFDELMRDVWSPDFYRRPAPKEGPAPGPAFMRTDVREKDGNYELAMELPGYTKEEISAQLEKGVLTIQAVHSQDADQKDEDGKYVRRERFYGECSRSFNVGEALRQEDIRARFENGILYLTFPKEVQPQVPEKKFISIEG